MGVVMESTKKRPRWLLWLRLFLRIGLALAVLGTLCGLVGFAALYHKFGRDLPDISVLETYRPAETTKIVASDGSVITTLYQENRVWAPLEAMSPWIVPALLATEDSRYFEHHGVDPIGIARVIYNTVLTRQAREGASTITMQLARNVFPLGEDDKVRKIKEMFLSVDIERHYSKEKILELYLNQVYFGAGAYGVHSAARVYFNKGPKDLSLAQASLLAGLIQAPSRFNPLEHKDRAFTRQDEVLGRMKAVGSITQAQYDEAIAERDKFHFDSARAFELDRYPYFTSYVLRELSARYNEEELYKGGLTIVTTLDPAAQKFAQDTLAAEVNAASWELNVDSGALVLLENETGYIKALVGGLGWSEKNQFNRAFQARRQPGSSFKPATYGAALEAGYTPESRVNDSPVTYQDGTAEGWSPKNSDHRFKGVMTMRTALQGSRNVPAVKILDAVGVDNVISLAYQMGIRAEIPPNLSIALGAVEATPLEMAEFYSVIVNGGRRIPPTAIKMIKSSAGKVLEDHRVSAGRAVLSPQTANALVSILQDVVRAGTGTNAQVPGWPIAGKTGTTDSSVDAWFCGFSPYYTCTVWIGNDDNSPMYQSFGGDLPARIFRLVMGYVLEGKEYKEFAPYTPSGEAKDIVKSGEKLATASPTPEATTTPEVEASQTPEPAEEPQPSPSPELVDGRSYLLPETLDPPSGAGPGVSEPRPLVTPAPLPEVIPPPAGMEPPSMELPEIQTPPVPQEIEFNTTEAR